MAKIAEAFVDIRARTAGLRRGLNNAVRETRSAARRMTTALGGFGSFFGIGGGAVGGLAAAAGVIGSLRAFSKQQQAVTNLRSALSVMGEEVEKNMKLLQEEASAIQRVTTVGDETTLALNAVAIGFGVTADQADDVTKAAIGLSTKLGRELNPQMLQYIVLAQQGEFTMLQRYIPALRTATTNTEKFAIVQRFVNEGFKQAQLNTKTLGGLTIQLKNAMGDLAEEVGRLFSTALVDTGFLSNVRFGIELITDAIANLGTEADKTGGFFDNLSDKLAAAIQFVRQEALGLPEQTLEEILGDIRKLQVGGTRGVSGPQLQQGGGGGGVGLIARGIQESIQTATGKFTVAQASEGRRILERIARTNERIARLLGISNDTVGNLAQ